MKLNYSIGIGTKLIVMVTAVIIMAIGAVVYIATDLYKEESLTRAQESNKESAFYLSENLSSYFGAETEKLSSLISSFATSNDKNEFASALERFTKSHDNAIQVSVYRETADRKIKRLMGSVNPPNLTECGVEAEKLYDWKVDQVVELQKKSKDSVVVFNSSGACRIPTVTMSIVSLNKKPLSMETLENSGANATSTAGAPSSASHAATAAAAAVAGVPSVKGLPEKTVGKQNNLQAKSGPQNNPDKTSKSPRVPISNTVNKNAASTKGAPTPVVAGPPPSEVTVAYYFRMDLKQDSMMKLLSGRPMVKIYVVDSQGHLLMHSDQARKNQVLAAADLSVLPIVAKYIEGKLDNHQMEFLDDEFETWLGAFKQTNVGKIAVVSEIKKKDALAAVQRVRYRSFLVMIVVVCLAFLANFGFSQSLTRPLKELFSATEKIVDGKFDVRLHVDSSDEIGALSRAFNSMAVGLKERDKLKGAFDKFHSKEIAQKLLSGEIKLGGEKKFSTVFFSDIRGFTDLSEKMTPDQVVMMLNEYMTEMVRIIFKWHGVVDKYVGDAIVALWGVPNPGPDDAYNAVRASLEMREFLIGFNEGRLRRGLPAINIGIGLHSGEVLAGNIGSEQRLEYTVIGDTVNQASRIESANKAVGSDILISGATAHLVRSRSVELGPVIHIHAKGKSAPLEVFNVIGYSENGLIKTVLSEKQIEAIKNKKVEIEGEEEAKVKVAGAKSSSKEKSSESFEDNDRTDVEGSPNTVGFRPPRHLRVDRDEDDKYWVVDELGGNPLGPFTFEALRVRLRGKQLSPQALILKEGEDVARAAHKVPGLMDRRIMPAITEPPPPPQIRDQAEEHEWYVFGPKGATLGPYSSEDLRTALQRGNITRTTYVWRSGLSNWVYLYEIPGFERRTAG